MVSTIVEHVRRASSFVGSSFRGRTFRPDAWVVHRLEARVRGLPHGRSRNVRTADGHVSFACEVSRLFRSHLGMDLFLGHVRSFVRSFLGLFVRLISSFSSHVFVLGRCSVGSSGPFAHLGMSSFVPRSPLDSRPSSHVLVDRRTCSRHFVRSKRTCACGAGACGVTTTVCRSLLPHHLVSASWLVVWIRWRWDGDWTGTPEDLLRMGGGERRDPSSQGQRGGRQGISPRGDPPIRTRGGGSGPSPGIPPSNRTHKERKRGEGIVRIASPHVGKVAWMGGDRQAHRSTHQVERRSRK